MRAKNVTAALAIKNNLDWYRAVMDARGARHECTAHWWALKDRAPPYYSDFVTRTASGTAEQFAKIREITAEPKPHRWSVADCYARLNADDMVSLGFSLLLEAQWFGGMHETNSACETDLQFAAVRTADELVAWESQWQVWSPTANIHVFRASLLTSPDHTFWTARSGDATVGGAITHTNTDTLGLSNVFFHGKAGVGAHLRDTARHAFQLAKGRPVVGYGDNTEIRDLAPLGVQPLGNHRVWVSTR